jgi:hypothetical protein
MAGREGEGEAWGTHHDEARGGRPERAERFSGGRLRRGDGVAWQGRRGTRCRGRVRTETGLISFFTSRLGPTISSSDGQQQGFGGFTGERGNAIAWPRLARARRRRVLCAAWLCVAARQSRCVPRVAWLRLARAPESRQPRRPG